MKYNSRHHIPSENDSRHHIGVFNRTRSLKDDRSYSCMAGKPLKNIQESDLCLARDQLPLGTLNGSSLTIDLIYLRNQDWKQRKKTQLEADRSRRSGGLVTYVTFSNSADDITLVM